MYGVNVVGGEFVNLRAAVDILFGEWSLILTEIQLELFALLPREDSGHATHHRLAGDLMHVDGGPRLTVGVDSIHVTGALGLQA